MIDAGETDGVCVCHGQMQNRKKSFVEPMARIVDTPCKRTYLRTSCLGANSVPPESL